MPKLKELDARVSRAIAPSVKHTNVYGEVVYTTFICKVCNEIGYYSEAYMESKSRRKHENDIREYHASCYIETNGRVRPKSELPTTTLESFIMGSDNE